MHVLLSGPKVLPSEQWLVTQPLTADRLQRIVSSRSFPVDHSQPIVPSRSLTAEFYMTDKRIVLTTASSEEEARKIAHHLIERRLAACVNLIPHVTSIYRWRGKVEEAREWLLVVKTTAAAFDQVREAIVELHSYELPECICLAIDDGSTNYLQWIAESVVVRE